MDVLLSSACGVDVHEKMIEACILMQKDSQIVPIRQRFSTLPKELSAFVKWLRENQCFDIAMESTGVYWKPVFETIERIRLSGTKLFEIRPCMRSVAIHSASLTSDFRPGTFLMW